MHRIHHSRQLLHSLLAISALSSLSDDISLNCDSMNDIKIKANENADVDRLHVAEMTLIE